MSKIFMHNKGKLLNEFIALDDTTLHCEHQLEVPLFQPPQPHDYISPSCSYKFLLDDSARSYFHPFNQMSSECVSNPSLHPLMINPHLETMDALTGNMVFDDTSFF